MCKHCLKHAINVPVHIWTTKLQEQPVFVNKNEWLKPAHLHICNNPAYRSSVRLVHAEVIKSVSAQAALRMRCSTGWPIRTEVICHKGRKTKTACLIISDIGRLENYHAKLNYDWFWYIKQPKCHKWTKNVG